MALALQASMELHGGEMNVLSRAGTLSRYRRYRELRMEIQTTALENISQSSFLDYAKRIGLSDGKVLIADDSAELILAFDLALYTVRPGRTRAIDRYARRRLMDATPDQELVMQALQASRFSIFRTVGRCEPAGVRLEDLLGGGAVTLLDEGLELSAAPGAVFAMRVAPIEDFVITCGVVVPLEIAIAKQLIDVVTDGASDAELVGLANDWHFIVSLYKLAIEFGLMSLMTYQ